MKPEPKAGDTGLVLRVCTSDEDRPEYERLRKGIIKVLEKFGGFEPEIDELLVDQIVSSLIYWKRCEKFLDSKSATELTYVRMADAKAKFRKMVDDALHELALTRRDRLNKKDEGDFTKQLRAALLKGGQK